MDLLLFEPQLSNFGGHYNRYVRVVAGEAARQGIKLSVASSDRIEPALRTALESIGVEVIPAFPRAPYRMRKDAAASGTRIVDPWGMLPAGAPGVVRPGRSG